MSAYIDERFGGQVGAVALYATYMQLSKLQCRKEIRPWK
jgi:hypothetical protein